MDDRGMRRTRLWFFLLTFSAGFTNLEAALGSAQAVSHHTGYLSQFALALARGRWQLMTTYLALVLLFFLGSLMAGIIFLDCEIGKSKRYGLFSLAQGLVTVLASFLLADSWRLALYFFAALALGAQNGILAFYRGIRVRTTHMTGYLTDAGVALGQTLRGQTGQMWKFRFYVSQVLAFVVGGLLAVLARSSLADKTMAVAGALQVLIGLHYLSLIGKAG